MTTVDAIGYVASALVLVAFYMEAMLPLRAVAIASNLAFITYAFGQHLYPVLVLHIVLLPLNCVRLFQICSTRRKIRDVATSEFPS